MSTPTTSEVGYTPAMPRREDHEVHKRTCVDIGGGSCWVYQQDLNSYVDSDTLTVPERWNLNVEAVVIMQVRLEISPH